MVQITLTNQNPLFAKQTATIDIPGGKYTLSDNPHEFELGQIFNQSEFSHRLLLEPFDFSADYLFHYEYSNIDELLYSAIYVYSILLNVDQPHACKFKISPSAEFQTKLIKNDIYIAIKSNQSADECIPIQQFNQLISRLMKIKFNYSDDVIIDDSFTIEELPALVNGDSFYLSDIDILPLLKTPIDSVRFELRYIDPVVGFGLFTRSTIKKGEIIALYTGIKSVNQPTDLHFTFIPRFDSLNMFP